MPEQQEDQHAAEGAVPGNVYGPIAAWAGADPSRLAVVSPRGRASFSDLDSTVAKAAAAMLSRGLRAGDRAGICAQRGLAHLVLSLASARIGVAHVALPASDSANLHAETASDLELAAIIRTHPLGMKRTLSEETMRQVSFDSDGDSHTNQQRKPS
jgi:acyl-coenzyme A synthetase/AMP-(fatty) acid ligase